MSKNMSREIDEPSLVEEIFHPEENARAASEGWAGLHWQVAAWRLEAGRPIDYSIGLSDDELQQSPSILSRTCPSCNLPMVENRGTTHCPWCKVTGGTYCQLIEEYWTGEGMDGEPLHLLPQRDYYYQVVATNLIYDQLQFRQVTLPKRVMRNHEPSLLKNKCTACNCHLLLVNEIALCLWCRCIREVPDNEVRISYTIIHSDSGTVLQGPVSGRAS